MTDDKKTNSESTYPIHFLNKPEAIQQPKKFEPCVTNLGTTGLEYTIIDTLKNIFDPEIPVNIYDLGLIHKITITESNTVAIEMTLTTPGCPVAQTFPQMIQDSVEAIEAVKKVSMTLVWDPPWSTDRLSDAIKLELGLL